MNTLKIAENVEIIAPIQELIERIMTEHWDIGACLCTVCVQGRAHGFHPRSCYPASPKVSILDDGSKERKAPVYDWTTPPSPSSLKRHAPEPRKEGVKLVPPLLGQGED